MVVAEAAAGLTALKATLDLFKATFEIGNASVQTGVVLDFKKQLLAAYTEYLALVERNRELEQKIMQLEAWDGEKQRYELADLGKGFFAYILKEGMEAGELAHALCAHCYQKRFKSILQNSGHPVIHDRTWDCSACKTKIKNQFNSISYLIATTRAPKAT